MLFGIFETYNKGNYQVIKIHEALHLTSNIDKLVDIIDDSLKKGILNIAIHFCDDSYLCSRTGAVLVRCWETIKDHNGIMAFVNVNRDIRDFLAVIDMESLIKIYSSEDEVDSIKSNAAVETHKLK